MAKRPSKVIVDARGQVLLRRSSGYHNRIGRIEKTADGYRSCASSPSSQYGRQPYCKNTKSKSAAVLHIVKHWRTWIGLPPGHTNY
jgi:hypothetical protein